MILFFISRRYLYLSTQLSIRLVCTQSVLAIEREKKTQQKSDSPTCLRQNNSMFPYRYFLLRLRRRLLFDKSLNGCAKKNL